MSNTAGRDPGATKSFWHRYSAALIGAGGAVLAAVVALVGVYFPRSNDGETKVDAPRVYRHGDLRLRAGTGYDLDSLATDWEPTNGGWSGQDVAYATKGVHDWVAGRNARSGKSGDSVAALDLKTPRTFDSCVKADFGAEEAAPRDEKINPKWAFCVLTSEGRYALLEIVSAREGVLNTQVTVWHEK
ncbi:hypothetical protein [Streptosporangium sp. NPDC051022]|uniref:hypothetical protein n=1 Tax=Streptosporangium sp. NPDC051022 TaxID=3155752 RepID=UPI00342BCBE5